jgi:hypothetical protein
VPERPVNNLPPGSQPWARDVSKAIDSAQFAADKANMNNKNAFKTINATLEQQANQLVQIQEQQEYLAGLKTRVDESASFALTAASTNGAWVWIGTTASITLEIPTGKALVTVNCPYLESHVNYAATMWYGVGYSLTGSATDANYSYSFGFGTTSGALDVYGSNATLTDLVTVSPGTHTFTASRAYFGNSLSSSARLKANPLRLIVQVIGND